MEKTKILRVSYPSNIYYTNFGKRGKLKLRNDDVVEVKVIRSKKK